MGLVPVGAAAGRDLEGYAQLRGIRHAVDDAFLDIVANLVGDGRGFDLAVAQDDEPAAMPPWFHLGCHLDSLEDVQAAFERMQASGVTIKRPFENHGDYVTFTASDPDGHGIEVYWDPNLRPD